MDPVPAVRIQVCNAAPLRPDAEYVLYWMIACRRVHSNFSLQRAIEWSQQLNKPLVILEALRSGYRWASDRIHRFVIEGMADNARRLRDKPVLYFPYVEPSLDAGKGLLDALAQRACVVVADEFPAFFLPQMVQAAANRLPVRVEQVDSNGLLPLRATDQVFTTAFSFRAFLQKNLRPHLDQFPRPNPFARVKLPVLTALPVAITQRWPLPPASLLQGDPAALAVLPIDHSVTPVNYRGGMTAAHSLLREFLDRKLASYRDSANHPDADARSGLSPYLHFGHIAAHDMFRELMSREIWAPEKLGTKTGGRREGWWNVSPSAEAWLDQFITWRELGYNMSSKRDDYDRYESLPEWAQATLAKHARDRRPHVYSRDEFVAARTHDRVWNAAQTQLVREGRIHNYLRMLWGKKILEWSPTPRNAIDTMIELNNRYAVDGRNPNSYSGIFWVLGRYDRPWGPERPIFGTVRYMSSENTVKKLDIQRYLAKYSTEPPAAATK